jgi:hypothetical protein
MTHGRRHDAAARAAPGSEEQSGVRLRGADSEPAPGVSELGQATSAERPREVTRCLRIEQKVRVGQVVLAALPSGDARARLLRTALVRRDEVLIDAVLEQLQVRA